MPRTKLATAAAVAVAGALLGLGGPAAPAGAQTPCPAGIAGEGAPALAAAARPGGGACPAAGDALLRTLVAADPAPSAAGDAELSIADVAELARPSVVDIWVGNDSGGSGVRVGAGVITSAHVVGDAKEVRLTLFDGTPATATVVRADAGYDLALLSTEAELPSLELEAAGRQRQGDTVVVLGFPGLGETALSHGATLTRGVISAVRTDEVTGATLIQTDAPVAPGNSGGALLNMRGRLIGVPAFTLGVTPGLGFAVAADTVEAFLEGHPSRRPVGRDLAAFLVPPAELGHDYRGTVDTQTARGRRAVAIAYSPTAPAVVQVLEDFGSPERAAQEAANQAASAGQEGLPEVRMDVTGGKRVFIRYTAGTQEMGVVAAKGPYLVTVFLDFDGLPDTGGRTELAVKIADVILSRLPA